MGTKETERDKQKKKRRSPMGIDTDTRALHLSETRRKGTL